MDFLIMLVGLGELIFIEEQPSEPIRSGILIGRVHFDGIEWANLHANLATHANRDVDVESLWMVLELAGVIRLLNRVFDDVDTLRWTFLFANQARHAAQSQFWIVAVVNQKWKAARVFFGHNPLFGVLH